VEVPEQIPLHTRVLLRANRISVAGSTSVKYVTAQRHCRATSVRTLRPACLLRPPTILHPREILILRLPVWTPRINIKTSDSRRVTTTAKGKTGTYRRNALRLPSIRTPRKIAR